MIIYIIPKNNFFYKGWTGSTSHAIGICNGIIKNGYDLLLCANKIDVKESQLIKDINVSSNSLTSLLRLFLIKRVKIEKIIIRYSFSSIFKILIVSFFSKILRLRTIIEVNTFFGHYRSGFLKNIRYVESVLLLLFDGIHVVSSGLKNDPAIKSIHKNIFYVPNGHNLKTKKLFFSKTVERQQYTLKYLGSMQPYYNFDDVKALLKKRKDIKLYIYGNVNQKFSSSKIIYKGKYNNNDFTKLVNPNSDILFLPYKKNSIAEYGFPTKLSEYLSCGAVIVSTNTGVLKNILGEIDKNLVYSDNNVASLEKAINHAIKLNLNQKNNLSAKYFDLSSKLKWSNLAKYIINEKNYE